MEWGILFQSKLIFLFLFIYILFFGYPQLSPRWLVYYILHYIYMQGSAIFIYKYIYIYIFILLNLNVVQCFAPKYFLEYTSVTMPHLSSLPQL